MVDAASSMETQCCSHQNTAPDPDDIVVRSLPLPTVSHPRLLRIQSIHPQIMLARDTLLLVSPSFRQPKLWVLLPLNFAETIWMPEVVLRV